MIKQYIPISLLAVTTLFGTQAVAQDQFTKDFEGVRQELTSWDPVRGEWLASSMVAMSKNQPIPDRMFPEDFTPMEMLKTVPSDMRTRIATTAQTQSSNNTDVASRESWSRVSSMMGRTNCRPVNGRTYGDPHLTSFDNASYSFQTVGEFILSKSGSGNFEVQSRQRAQTEDFSLNTAVAMNVSGDRVCFYAQEKPDGNNSTPIRLNGDAIYVDDQAYYLEHGGTIRKLNRNDYVVTWPTGETVSIEMRGQNSAFPFMNLSLQVYPCSDTYEGVLGNANGRSSDDFDTRGGSSRPANLTFHTFGNGANDQASREMEQEYLAFLAKDFARSWRVQQPTSLFDYGFGQSTFTYTDESFPRVHHTLADLSPSQRDNARRECERNGILAEDMNGCIYDRGFVNIPPSPRVPVPDRTVAYERKPVTNPQPNVNPGARKPVPPKADAESGRTTGDGGTTSPGPIAQPLGTNDQGGTKEASKETPAVRTPATGTTSTPQVEKPVERAPEPVARPVERTPVPVEKPVAKPAPAPTPEVEERPRGGFGRFLENAGSSSGSGNSGSGSSGSSSSSPTPVQRTPEPVRTAPAPKPAPTPAPAPARTSTPASRGGR